MKSSYQVAGVGFLIGFQLVIGALIPSPKPVSRLPSRQTGPRAESSQRQGPNYLGDYDGTLNSSVVQYAMSTDPQFSFILTEALALANGKGAATSEVLRAASQIIPGNFDSFFDEFYWLGEQIHSQALASKTKTSARESYFRASAYYRMSNYFLTGNASDPRLYGPWQQALDDFHEAISLQDIPGERFTVSEPGYQIPGYFWKTQKGDSTKAPTVVAGSGYDSPQEDTWHQLGQEVLDRGWNFVTYEGPGQNTVRRQQHIGFTPEWWDVVTPVVDYLAGRCDVDIGNVALVGISFGGVLAPLGASREPRLKAVLSIDGLTDFHEIVLGQLGSLTDLYLEGNARKFDAAIREAYPELPTSSKWALNQGLWSFNTDSYYDYVNQTGAYKLTPAMVGNITGYGWVGKGENDTSLPGQELELVALYNQSGKHDAAFHYFPSNLGAGLHCQLGAEPQLAAAAFDWLDGIFGL